jgi:hypothetical protein
MSSTMPMAAVSASPARRDTFVLTLRLLDVHSQPVSDTRRAFITGQERRTLLTTRGTQYDRMVSVRQAVVSARSDSNTGFHSSFRSRPGSVNPQTRRRMLLHRLICRFSCPVRVSHVCPCPLCLEIRLISWYSDGPGCCMCPEQHDIRSTWPLASF